ncbi:MAG: hypothetical protein ACO3NZ_16150 [Pirellulales bacterium]
MTGIEGILKVQIIRPMVFPTWKQTCLNGAAGCKAVPPREEHGGNDVFQAFSHGG